MSKKHKLTAEQLAENIVNEMAEAGLSVYDMMRVIQLAKVKYKRMQTLKS